MTEDWRDPIRPSTSHEDVGAGYDRGATGHELVGRNVGRPSDYGPEIVAVICDRLAAGETLRGICRDEAMPSQSMVFRWIREYDEFREQYARAREVQADTWADEIVEIADDGSNDWMERNSEEDNGGYRVNGEHIQRSKVRIDTRKWLMGKAAPKKYGERVENVHTGPDGGSATFTFKLDRPAQS